MTRVDKNKYSVLIRSDYLYQLGKLFSTREERDKFIQEAINHLLENYTFEEISTEIRAEQSLIMKSFPAKREPSYHTYLEFVRLPDGLVAQMKGAGQPPFMETKSSGSLGIILNTAIRIFLIKKDPSLFKEVNNDGLRDA